MSRILCSIGCVEWVDDVVDNKSVRLGFCACRKHGCVAYFAKKRITTENEIVALRKLSPYVHFPAFYGISEQDMWIQGIQGKNLYDGFIDEIYRRATRSPFDIDIRCTPFELEWIESISKQLLNAISCMHANGVAHRDIKPENIMLTENKTNIILIDFDLAVLGDAMTACIGMVGTKNYFAPEIVKLSKYSRRAYDAALVDYWCVGAVIYEMVYGIPPFHVYYQKDGGEGVKGSEVRYEQCGLYEAIETKEPILIDSRDVRYEVQGYVKSLNTLIKTLLCKVPNKRIVRTSGMIETKQKMNDCIFSI